jgi:ATP-dependent DNA helicase RecQ
MLKTSAEDLTKKLQELQAHGIIQYSPQKEKPQIFLLQNRVRADDLQINIANYRKRKEQYETRVKAMVGFIYASALCRSVMIGNYFGDASIKACGICDVCLNSKKTSISKDEFESLHLKILSVLKPAPLGVRELMQQFKNESRDKVMEVIRFLQSENKIIVSEDGRIECK